MLINFFQTLKKANVPVSIKELLDLLTAMEQNLAFGSMDEFYLLARTVLVKDEKYYDRFDRAFGAYFKNLQNIDGIIEALLPEDWLRKEFEKHFTDEEKAKVESLGGLEKLIEEFKKRLEEQQGRHEGGNKWVGTNGTSPFGNGGFNPEGIRIGGPGGKGTAVKVWDERQYQDLDDSVEIARNAGMLDIKMVPERHNAVKVLIFFDVGGSMDPYVRLCEELFSAAKTEFKHLEYFYFHNCMYDYVWKDNVRRRDEQISTYDLLNKYSADYKVIYVGDASMAPYEVTSPGGSVEYHNEESGAVWMQRMSDTFEKLIWINPVQEKYWEYTPSIIMLRDLINGKMFPLTLGGLEKGMSLLSR